MTKTSNVFLRNCFSVSVTEGDSVTLNPDLTEIQTMDLIMWKFGPKDILIAQMNKKKSTVYDNNAAGRFRDRLKLDQTGSLIITNTTITDSELYKVYIKTDTPFNTFNLTVYAPLPIPVIITAAASSCVFLCSVVNVGHVTLSWYKGNSLLSSISVSDLSRSLSLHLECLDDSYSCVINNPISNQTQHLNTTELCQTCPDDCICCCGFTEAVIRLALSALVGVATVAVLVYDIRSRNPLQKKKEQTSPSNS
uniref:Ig-like domain-containing protein n=1 Tax=Cyprinus carpio TaxID=7962 RepID=A0A8C2GSD0_CYPCA